MSDLAETKTDAAGHAPSPPASSHARTPFVDGLGQILLGALWIFAPFLVKLLLPVVGVAGGVSILLIEETRSAIMSEAGAAVLLFAGLARAATPWAVGREQLSLRWLGKIGFLLLLLSFVAWVTLSVSFLIPGLWPSPFSTDAGAAQSFAIPNSVYWADLAIVAALYAALGVFALQILATLAVGLIRGQGRVGPAAMALMIASLLALFALPDDLRHSWNDLADPPSAVGVEEEIAEGLSAKAFSRRDGRYYVFDQIKPISLDFVAIAAALGVLCIAVWRGGGGALRWSWLASTGLLVFGLGACFTLANIGFVHPQTMVRAMRFAVIVACIPLFLLLIVWFRTLLAKGARRGVPALWALAALLPSAAAIIAVPAVAQALEQIEDQFDFWKTAFDRLDAMLLVFAGFAGWYALQHRLTGRETSRFWGAAHLVIAFMLSAGAVFGPYYQVYFEAGFEMATATLDETGKGAAFWTIFLFEYAVFALGLALARTRLVSRFEPATSASLGAASRAASAAKPKQTFQRRTLFGGEEQASTAEEPERLEAPDAPSSPAEAASEKPEAQAGQATGAEPSATETTTQETASPDSDKPAEASAGAVPEEVVVVSDGGDEAATPDPKPEPTDPSPTDEKPS